MTNNENTDFERNVRSSLKDYEVPFQPSDWEEMESKLNALPKSSSVFRFKWTFSTNIFLVLLGCAGLFFLFSKVTGSSAAPNKASVPAHEKITPVVNPATAVSVPVSPSMPAANADEKNADEITTPPVSLAGQSVPVQVQPVPSGFVQKQAATIPDPSKSITQSAPQENAVSASDNSRPGPLNPDLMAPTVRIFPDQIDPSQGYIYSTKEKTSAVPTANQSNVNIGWNTYVIYDPKTNEKDTVKAQAIVPASERIDPEYHIVKKDKSERKGKSSKASKDAVKDVVKEEKKITSEDTSASNKKSDAKAVISNTSKKDDAPADSVVKKNRRMGKKPKFQGDKSLIDP